MNFIVKVFLILVVFFMLTGCSSNIIDNNVKIDSSPLNSEAEQEIEESIISESSDSSQPPEDSESFSIADDPASKDISQPLNNNIQEEIDPQHDADIVSDSTEDTHIVGRPDSKDQTIRREFFRLLKKFEPYINNDVYGGAFLRKTHFLFMLGT